MAVLYYLDEAGSVPFQEDGLETRYIVGISLFNGLALAGLVVLQRFRDWSRHFPPRLALLTIVFMLAVALRAPLNETDVEVVELSATILWETGRAICAAFAIAYMAHAIYSRYLPTTILRVRDITPVLHDGRSVDGSRLRHIKNARWLFDLGDRHYLDSTKLELRTVEGPSFDWRSWGEATMWTGILLLSFSIYIEVYPRVADSFGVALTAVMSGHLLTLIPLLMLNSYPVERLGAVIPTEGRLYHLSHGYNHTAFRWTKLSFIPIIVIALLVRGDLVEQDWASLAETMLICLPIGAMVNLVYLDVFRDRTVAEVHRAIPRWEAWETELYGHEPWRERSLMEGVEPLTFDDL
jgi:hypothetical protein